MSRSDRCSLLARNGALRAFCVFLILLLAACGKSEAPPTAQTASKPKAVQKTDQAKPAAFGLSDASTETYDGQLSLALTFTQNVAGA